MAMFVLYAEAEIDIAGISEYTAKRNVAAAIKMLDRIQEACRMLALSVIHSKSASMSHEFLTQAAIFDLGLLADNAAIHRVAATNLRPPTIVPLLF